MGCNRVIVARLAVGVMNHGPSTVERANRSRDFRGEINKIVFPLCAFQSVEIKHSPFHVLSVWGQLFLCSRLLLKLLMLEDMDENKKNCPKKSA